MADEQSVRAGQPLFELENLQLVASETQAEQELAAAEIRMLRYRELKRPAEEAAERQTVAAMSQRLQSLRQQHASLIVTAPCDGIVLIGDTEQQLGAWYHEGDALVRVVNPQMKRVVAAISPDVASAFARGNEVAIALDHLARESFSGQVRQLASPSIDRTCSSCVIRASRRPLAVHESVKTRPVQTTTAYISAEIALNDPLDELRPGQTS